MAVRVLKNQKTYNHNSYDMTWGRRSSLAADILKGLALGAALFVVLSSPYGARKFSGELMKYLKRRWKKEEEIRNRLYYLRKKKLISFKDLENETEIILTEEGRRHVMRYDFQTMEVKKPLKWDAKWRIVLFDIPDDKKKARDALRFKLVRLGFIQFNKSVWAYPYECKSEIDFVSEYFGIGPYVHYLVTDSITNDSQLREKFKLSKSL